MKENVSIIFAALVGVFLVVLLPLFSILDRQDSMAYNVVLTETTKFVDKVRANGFIDSDSYNKYITAISSTGNTYKVTIRAYKKLIINETYDNGEIIDDSFIEEKELYNTKDILKELAADSNTNSDQSIHKNNTYLFNQDDEFYVSVENTNTTTGSIIYSMLANTNNIKVVDINYGGVVNNVNWELYEKIQAEAISVPEVVMSVPVNKDNNTNVKKVDNTGTSEFIDCTLDNIDETIGETELTEICSDIVAEEGQNYTYLYDLSEDKNKQIRVAVELRGIDKLNTGTNEKNEDVYTKISDLSIDDFNDVNGKSNVEKYIIENYIRTYGMYSPTTDIDLRQNKNYYVFDIYFNDIVMSSIDYISTKATIVILPGLGQDKNGTLSLGAESVEIELLDEEAVNTVKISAPHIWEKFLKTKSRSESIISTNTVYVNEDIAFVVSYTGIKDHTDEEIKQALTEHLKIYSNDRQIDGLEIYTAQEFKEKYNIDLITSSAGHIVIKFRYIEPNDSSQNYVQIMDRWITTNMTAIDAEELGYEPREYAMGVVSSHYEVLIDTLAPLEPTIALSGTAGYDDWYISDVDLTLIPSITDYVMNENKEQIGGSGVARNTLTLTGKTQQAEKEYASLVKITANGTTNAIAKAYDYVGNVSQVTEQIKIDKEKPTQPTITLSGTEGDNGWYKSDVTINIIPGTDNVSGVKETTYKIEGANELGETSGTTYTLSNSGTSKIIATTYDNAGNETETTLEVKIDKTIPPEAEISVVSGDRRTDSIWYYTDVKVKITAGAGEAISGFGKIAYKIVGDNQVPITEIQGNETEITLNTNGTHHITVYTYTAAGVPSSKEFTVKIDKDAPKAPTIDTPKAQGENSWYTETPVKVNIVQNEDVGPSFVSQIRYTITKDGITGGEIDITKTSKTISFTEEGKYILKVYARDSAFNEVAVEKEINIDTTPPTPAVFVITGENGETEGILGNNEWYIKPILISYKGGSDAISGIESISLSRNSINQDTNSTQVTLTTKDKAGHTVTQTKNVKVDTTAPKAPKIEILTQHSSDDLFGFKTYNGKVKIKLTPSKDHKIQGVDNTEMTMCEINAPDGLTTKIIENEQDIEIDKEGQTSITLTTYDKAGNQTSVTENIWINKTKPAMPVISEINNVSIDSSLPVISDLATFTLGIENLNHGNKVTIKLYNKDTQKTQMVNIDEYDENKPIEITLNDKGTYTVRVTQTNMFGTVSDEGSLLDCYIYE